MQLRICRELAKSQLLNFSGSGEIEACNQRRKKI
jgi:hypothetical protein